ncbi:MAG TPA: hypothetical protein DCS67_06870 [Clostridiales bacterium UBA8960]|nr:hypothetical protein [Clostridiales bacterium UBA8960]
MHRILPNVLFLIILFILATAFPLSTDILSLNLSTKIVEKPVDEIITPARPEPILPTDGDFMGFEAISFDIESTTGVFPSDFLADYEVLIQKHGIDVDRLKLSTLTLDITDGMDGKKTVTLNKGQLMDSRPSGYYTFSIANSEDVLDYTWFGSNMAYDKTLLGTSNTLSATQLAFTLFFPTADYKQVVPITRIVPLPDNRWRALYTALLGGPKAGLGLTEMAPAIPYAPNIRISQNVASIYMYPANLAGYEDKFPTIIEAVTKTFMTLGPLEGVKFYVNDSSAPYSGSDLSLTYAQSAASSVFTGYSNNSEFMMLMPIPLVTSLFEDRVEEIWQALKLQSDTLPDTQGLIQVIPDEVHLISHSLENGVLTLDLSENFNQLFDSQAEYKKLLVHSLLYSYTSLPEVQSLRITVKGAPYIDEHFDFTSGLVPNRFYNMEP